MGNRQKARGKRQKAMGNRQGAKGKRELAKDQKAIGKWQGTISKWQGGIGTKARRRLIETMKSPKGLNRNSRGCNPRINKEGVLKPEGLERWSTALFDFHYLNGFRRNDAFYKHGLQSMLSQHLD